MGETASSERSPVWRTPVTTEALEEWARTAGTAGRALRKWVDEWRSDEAQEVQPWPAVALLRDLRAVRRTRQYAHQASVTRETDLQLWLEEAAVSERYLEGAMWEVAQKVIQTARGYRTHGT